MANARTTLMIFLLAACLTAAGACCAVADGGDADKTLSPYFLVKGDDSATDRLPLKSTRAAVAVAGVIADVKVTQVYKNEGQNPLEALYVFPASTRAAVYGMKMTIGERTIVAEIREREKARREYERAKEEGRSASLLEQHRPNVFQMNVANILPGNVVQVELRYTELLVPRDAVYEFVYPTVVGPRYVEAPSGDSVLAEDWTANPYLHQGEPPPYTFDLSLKIAAGLPIQDINCPSHETKVEYQGPDSATIRLSERERQGGNRDFILRYRLAGGRIETGLLLFEGQEENFFLLMLQPPAAVRESRIPPRETIFIVDVSGSMHGFPLDTSKGLLRDLISKLRPTDRFNVLLFAGSSRLMAPESLPASPENIRRALDFIDRERGGGGTRLLPALERALSLPGSEGSSRTIVIATDGYVAVEKEAFDLIRNNLHRANIFPFGIGSSVNRHLIEGMARLGMGEPFVVTDPAEASRAAAKFRALIASPVLTGIKVGFDGFEVYDVEPPAIPDLLADRPIVLFGKWRSRPQGVVRLQGLSGERAFLQELDVSAVKPDDSNAAVRYLWARHRIAVLSDYNQLEPDDQRTREVTHLGLTYNLLTAYTSFVAVDTRIRVKDGKAVTVKQPLPLPQGVSDHALGEQALAGAPAMAMQKASPGIMDLARRFEFRGAHRMASEAEVSAAKQGLTIDKVLVTEGLGKETVQDLLQKYLPSLRQCCGSATAVAGEWTFKLVIDAAGRVTEVRRQKGPDQGGEIEKCLARELGKLRFPKPVDGRTVEITVTLVLK